MAKMTVNAGEDLINKLAKLSKDSDIIAKKVVRAGANPLADEIRKNIQSLPVEEMRTLQDGEKFDVITSGGKKDLLDGLGVTPPGMDKNGNTNVKVGFEGYGSYPTKKYHKGIPNALLARSIESGSSVRQKKPFIRPAINKTKEKCKEEMSKKFDEEVKIYAL
jgi:HK97 gp10 family phage protein